MSDPTGPVGDYVGTYQAEDPREVLRVRAARPGPEGWVMVRAAEITAVYRMRVCRSTARFDSDEDGPMPPTTVYCVEQAGHNGGHGNGYFTWSSDNNVPGQHI